MVCTDRAGSSILCDAGIRSVEPVPSLNWPKGPSPVSFSVALAGAADPGRARALYVLDRFPASRSPCNFEALTYAYGEVPGLGYGEKCWRWQWQRLPQPPFVSDTNYECTDIRSYALLDGGSTVCISGAAATAVGTGPCRAQGQARARANAHAEAVTAAPTWPEESYSWTGQLREWVCAPPVWLGATPE